MAEQFLNGPNVLTALKQVRSERVAKGMAAYVFRNTGGSHCVLDTSNKIILVDVMAADHACSGIG
jgi:hypothetical protein